MMLLALVAAGGALGALARYGVDRAALALVGAGPADGAFPWATLAINTSGAIILAVLLALVQANGGISQQAWAFLAVGILGSYTTFSTMAADSILLAQSGAVSTAAAYLLVVPAVGLGAAIIAFVATRSIVA